jgi:hypothetical protein
LRVFLVQHGHELVVHLVLPDLGTVDERGGAKPARAAAADQHTRDDDGDPHGRTTSHGGATQDTSHEPYFLTLRTLVSKYPVHRTG